MGESLEEDFATPENIHRTLSYTLILNILTKYDFLFCKCLLIVISKGIPHLDLCNNTEGVTMVLTGSTVGRFESLLLFLLGPGIFVEW